QPFYDVSRKANAVYRWQGDPKRPMLRDRNEVAFRLYHWLQGQASGPNAGQVVALADLNVPDIIGDPPTDELLRSATWAILGAGTQGVLGNAEQLPVGTPQNTIIGLMQQKVGVGAESTQQAIQDKIRQAAMADNIVELLP